MGSPEFDLREHLESQARAEFYHDESKLAERVSLAIDNATLDQAVDFVAEHFDLSMLNAFKRLVIACSRSMGNETNKECVVMAACAFTRLIREQVEINNG